MLSNLIAGLVKVDCHLMDQHPPQFHYFIFWGHRNPHAEHLLTVDIYHLLDLVYSQSLPPLNHLHSCN